ncbi:hypothetical protein PENSUB_9681 [Penicillium subrubescens]|uniref:Carbohydrate kinase PfkB domain-containing protein n=1 Tax=Penicillium subrubescens TaxID=1316194 RepID=A0A1Q5TBZ9_9EURO|nr:hypothetical protein PENSUB_9681 [Penicillium subrubescens]
MQASNISFTSLGLVVLDEIRCPDWGPLTDILGGSGTYAKGFKYTTPILAVQEDNLKHTSLLDSKAFHYLAGPEDLKARVSKLLALRAEAGIEERPLIIWEPSPLSCGPENLEACMESAASVDILSPNHLELARLFSEPQPDVIDKDKIEDLASKCLDRGVGPDGNGTLIVRAGENGCFISNRNNPAAWLDPFYATMPGETPNAKTVDPTGAGNAFLGSYAVGYLETGSVIKAACYGSVGASFALEQVGMPQLSVQGNEELWNGVNVLSRLEKYMSRQKCGREGDEPEAISSEP